MNCGTTVRVTGSNTQGLKDIRQQWRLSVRFSSVWQNLLWTDLFNLPYNKQKLTGSPILPERHLLHLTVAALVVHQQKFLFVEERDKFSRQLVLNQPAGHVEAGEDLQSAVSRELFEETGLSLTPDAWLGISQLHAANGHFYYRVNFLFEPRTLPEHYRPQDPDILALHWLDAAGLVRPPLPLRSSLVETAVTQYLAGHRLPLSTLTAMVNG